MKRFIIMLLAFAFLFAASILLAQHGSRESGTKSKDSFRESGGSFRTVQEARSKQGSESFGSQNSVQERNTRSNMEIREQFEQQRMDRIRDR